jgi:hypothetical protein
VSERAKILLLIVAQHTDRDWSSGEVKSFFVPNPGGYYVNGKQHFVSGAGDAKILRTLQLKGLIERPKTSLPNKYIYALTEDGLLVTQGIDETEL